MNVVEQRPVRMSQSTVNHTVRDYWDQTLHDQTITQSPVGSPAFFRELDEYHFDKQRHLLTTIDFNGYRGRQVLDIGCGVGIDLARYARGGAVVTGVDLSAHSIALARQNFAQLGLHGELHVMDAEHLDFPSESFDLVYIHDVIHYAANPEQIIRESHRVLRPGGTALLQTYNRRSWLWIMSKVAGVELEHRDAPIFTVRSVDEFKQLLGPFRDARVFTERFPVRSRLHGSGIKGLLYNEVLVRAFDVLPRRIVGRYGWHAIALATKPVGGNT